ncbi:MAG TPA: PadR family transcriptional regulator [Bacteroidales bacterium]|nr:PadR family transcriptional regulator [Bacteroidales bacterium]
MTQQNENTEVQMRKGVLEYCILLILSKQDAYSSDIIDTLRNNDVNVAEGTLYPLLARLKNNGALQYRWEESKSGPPRKYYHLTAEGAQYLEMLDNSWQRLQASINNLRELKSINK